MNPSDTDAITQQQFFLSTLANGLTSGQHLLVAKRVTWADREAFPAEEWREQVLQGPWYFSTGASNSKKRRRHENMVALRAIVLDDVGTKVKPEAILAEPSWKLETSAGNFQWGYLLADWTDDITGGDALFSGLIAAGLQDKGVKTCCRLFRIPGSVNDKPGRDGFVAVLREWEPGRVYTLKSLAAALHVKPGKPASPRQDSGERPYAGKPDPWFRWLHEKGHVLREATGGWWHVRCPFGDEHGETDKRPECSYKPLSETEDGIPGAMCWHGHNGITPGEYKRRFFAWIEAEGGPKPPAAAASLDDFRDFLNGLPKGRQPVPNVRKAPKPPRSDLFTFSTLAAALGSIPKSILPRPDKTEKGFSKLQPCTFDNVEAGLAHLGVQVRLNLMNGKTSYILPERIDMAGFGVKSALEVDGMIDAALCDIFSGAGMRSKKELRDAFARIANSLYWHPAKDWIESKPWDGQDRFRALLGSITTDTPDLLATYFRRWALQVIEAACGWEVRRESQKSLCFILAGDQGIGKTRWLMALAPGFCAEGKHLSLDGNGARDSKHEALQGVVVELGEMDTTFGRSANGSLKAFLSTTVDEYRLPYAADWLTRPRCTSFCGSVNNRRFLQDTTGNRRFAAVWVDRCEPEHGIDMQQLWAQVHTWWEAGEPWWLTDEEAKLQAASNDQFQTTDGVAEAVEVELGRRGDRSVYMLECAVGAHNMCRLIGVPFNHNGIVGRVTETMTRLLGKERDFRHRGGGPRCWAVWLDPVEAKSLGLDAIRPVKT